MRPKDWAGRAACRDEDIELFFAMDAKTIKLAKQVCARCPVRESCREAAMDPRDPSYDAGWAVRGGMTVKERRAEARAQRLNIRVVLDLKGHPSRYLGVVWEPAKRVWRAELVRDGRLIFLGSFPDTREGERQAALAHDRAARHYDHDYAMINFLEAQGA